MTREVRIRMLPDKFTDGSWSYEPQRIVRLGGVGSWAMVRAADFPHAAPFVISEKDWQKLEQEPQP